VNNEAEMKPGEEQYDGPEPGVIVSVIAGIIYVVGGIFLLLSF